MRVLATAFSTFALLATPISANAVDMKAQNIDLNRYLGKWHEIARMPMFFQRGCHDSVAEYKKIDAKTVSVHNSCERNGREKEITGDAIVEGPGKLAVSFSKWMPRRANYWVLYVDPGYKYAVVGEPRSKYGWILSRTPKLAKAKQEHALKVLQDNGYKTSKLIWNNKK